MPADETARTSAHAPPGEDCGVRNAEARCRSRRRSGDGPRLTATTPGPTTGRAQRVTANLTIEVSDTDALSKATQQALQTTRSLGGYVVSVSYATGTDGTSSLTVRVPTSRVQDAITRLSSLGTIVAQQVQIDDLQESIDALGKRIAGLQERIARLTAQIEDPSVDAETRATLDGAALGRARRAARAAARPRRADGGGAAWPRSSSLSSPTSAAAVPGTPSRFDRALDQAVEILAWEATIVLFALVLIGPFVLIGLAVWWGRRTLAAADDAARGLSLGG